MSFCSVFLCPPSPTGWTWLAVFSTQKWLSESLSGFPRTEITEVSNVGAVKYRVCVYMQTTWVINRIFVISYL